MGDFLGSFRTAVGRYLLSKKLRGQSRVGSFINFSEAKKIGIIYDGTDEGDNDLVKMYVRDLRMNFQKEVHALGFVNKRELPPNRLSKLGMDYFTKKDLNWWYLPQHPVVRNFIHENFDLLMDLDTKKCFPLQALSSFTKARFRIGKYREGNTQNYDMMINLEEGKSLKQFIEQADHFIRQINKQQEAQQA